MAYLRSCALLVIACCVAVLATSDVRAQRADFDASWYDSDQPYVKIAVVEDGVYQVTGADLAAAGVPTSALQTATLRLLENGREIPIRYTGAEGTGMGAADAFTFVGQRNRGTDETWAYNDNPEWQSSTYFSLYTDTTTYWLTWGGEAGLRYETPPPPTATTTFTTLTTFRDTLHLEEDDRYHKGDASDAGNPLYTRGEGYYGYRFWHNTQQNTINQGYDVPLESPTSADDDVARVRVRLNGQTRARHLVSMSLRLQDGGSAALAPVDTLDWEGYAYGTLEAAIPQSRLPDDGNLRVELTSSNLFNSPIPNGILLDWIEVTYERALTATSGELVFTAEQGGPSTFALDGFSAPTVEVYNPADVRVFRALPLAGAHHFNDAPSPGAVYWAVAPGGYRAPVRFALDRSSDWANPANRADYLIVTTAALRASADALAAFRTSEVGGGYEVAVLDVKDVFDQFDYGRPTPLALRRLVRTAEGWAQAPRFLMLWGDALAPSPDRPREPWEVLSYGDAPSDGWFAMQQAGPSDWSESLAIGRIPIRDNEAGRLFIEKSELYETTPPQAWQKRALFLAGGTSEAEQRALQTPTLQWSEMAATPPTGMDTLHFFKRATTALDPTFQDSLEAAIERGVSWMSYFGHSATSTWEIVTEPPRDFDNAGRLPVVLSLGCYTGDFSTGSGGDSDILSFAEQLVIESENGSIAHWGSSNLGTIGESAALSSTLHELVFEDSLRTLGLALQETKAIFNANRTYNLAVKHLLQYGLIGDPATRIILPTRPDLAVTPASIAITPSSPTPNDGVLQVDVRVQNFGLVPADSVLLHLTHRAPSGSETVYRQKLAPFKRDTSASFEVAIDDAAVGDNVIRVDVDPDDAYEEASEVNNQAERTQTVFSTGLTLVGPPNFGLLPEPSPTLRVAVASGDGDETSVLFQLDVVPTFDSPALREERTSASLLATWQPSGIQDDTPYYWRARIDNPEEPGNWKEATFTVREDLGKTGWIQQEELFTPNEESGFLERTDGAWRFKQFGATVSVATGIGPSNGQFVVNGELYERTIRGIALLILDGTSGTIKGHGTGATYENSFEDPAAAYEEIKALAALAEPGDYVLARFRNLSRQGSAEIPDSVKAILRDLGSTTTESLTYSNHWLMISKVGSPEETVERTTQSSEIVESASLTFSFGEGQTLSPVIGPARAWQSLGWEADLTGSDRIRVDVLSADGDEVLLGDVTDPGNLDLSSIDAREVPFLRLRATLQDTLQRSAPDLIQWHMAYEGVTDLALDEGAFQLAADTLREGAMLDVTVGVLSLTGAPANVAVLEYHLTNAANETALVARDTLRNLADAVTRTQALPTDGRVGRGQLRVRVVQPGFQDPTASNNVLIRSFFVQGDQTPPTFDVFVEGAALPNDPDPVVDLQDPALPFVPPNPTIEIEVEDDDPYAKLSSDSSAVTVELDGERIPYAAFDVIETHDNEVRLRFEPELGPADTTHTLVVTVRDASGNVAPGSPYQVHFRTQSEAQVESLYPYPNPMNNYTVFAFRLRGRDAMLFDEFRLRIYTLTGRLVREFNLLEEPYHLDSGGLRIDWNKLRWDGRDQDGDLIATGVYLYKVFARVEGEPMRVNNAAGIEKLVVIR